MKNNSYAYELAYPESMGGRVFYIGKGSLGNSGVDRIDVHEQEARRGHECEKCQIIREIWDAGEEVVKRKIQEGLSNQEARELEKQQTDIIGFENLTNRAYEANRGLSKWVTPEWKEKRRTTIKAGWAKRKKEAVL